MNDVKVFQSQSMNSGTMKERLPGCEFIGDSSYSGVPAIVSTNDKFDPREASEFKDRVMARMHNQRLKFCGVLTKHFGDRIEVHHICFRSVCMLGLCFQNTNRSN